MKKLISLILCLALCAALPCALAEEVEELLPVDGGTALVESPDLPAVQAVSVEKDSVEAGQNIVFTVLTGTDAEAVTMFNENDNDINTWKDAKYYADEEGVRTWTVRYALNGAGDRRFTFRVTDGEAYGFGQAVDVKIYLTETTLFSAKAEEDVASQKEKVTFQITSVPTAETLTMYSENGKKVHSWKAEKNSKEEDGTRVWTVKYAFNNTGNRKMTFKATAGETEGAGKTASVKITKPGPAVVSVAASVVSAAVKESVTFTIVTPKEAKFLALYVETGKKIKVWSMTKSSVEEEDNRVWTVKYAFASAGTRKITFRASSGGGYGDGQTVQLKIEK